MTERSVRENTAFMYWNASVQARSPNKTYAAEGIDDLEVIAMHTDWPRLRCAACRMAKAQAVPCPFDASANCLSGGGRNCVSLA
ncbi:MAG: hypothetical protein HYU59_05590 [Magnetospirillum gryphiswaldense]|nr:hypothetical protein [Magnetospirillum gryphiswaldense]